MAGEDDEISVIIEDSTGITDVGDGGTQKGEKNGAGADNDDPIASLKGQLDEMRSHVSTAQQTATSAVATAQQAAARLQQTERDLSETKSALGDSRLSTIIAGISAAEATLADAERDLEAAFDAGNGSEVAKAQRRVAEAVADLRELRQSKAEFEASPRREERREPQQPAQNADPVEAFIQSRTPPSQNWLRQHRDYVADPVKSKRLTAAHYKADAEGIVIDSPQYFDFIEQELGLKQAPAADKGKDGGERQQLQRRPAAPTAPVTPSGGGIGGSDGKLTVKLTRGEAAAATDGTLVWNYPDPTGKNRWKVGDPIGVQEMARRKAQGIKEGRYDRVFTDQ
jgi:hypothetical protein